ncbi:aminotransferase class V-fold PLP-dependent enzyme [Desulfonatronospira sp.]|uniref:aminotransferase class V-fold PLP-dependent enzyme n=1 Tax=Desulfonatronospira sp. TaxID=1962951 RepID=UPI0025BFBDDB|nr:aminotransferase class V-fold PLP-dependent enzyme [Desulfonatronospira sp.]
MDSVTYLTPETGPLPEKVRRAMGRNVYGMSGPELQAACKRINAGLQLLLGTLENVRIMLCGLDDARQEVMRRLFDPGSVVLVVEAGLQGLKLSDAAQACGLEVVALPIPWERAVKPGEVENTLTRWPEISGVIINRVEMSTGALHPVQEISGLCRSFRKKLIVDATGSLASHACRQEAWGADCVLSASGADSMTLPGAVFLAPGALFSHETRGCSVPDVPPELLLDGGRLFTGSFFSREGLHILPGLDAALGELTPELLNSRLKKANALCVMARAGIEAMGLEILVQRNFSAALTCVRLNPGIDAERLLQTAGNDYKVVMSRGQKQLKERVLRMGHSGSTCWKDILAGLAALYQAYRKCYGVCGARDYLEKAWQAYCDHSRESERTDGSA